jgi:hypothetical protein
MFFSFYCWKLMLDVLVMNIPLIFKFFELLIWVHWICYWQNYELVVGVTKPGGKDLL